MNRIFSFLLLFCLCLVSGTSFLQAQTDTGAKRIGKQSARAVDSEKNQILIQQSDVFESIQVDRIGDSIRLIQLNKEIQELNTEDNKKKRELSIELDQIRSRDSLNYRALKHQVDSMRSIVSGFPVILDYDTLFYIYARLGSFTPEARARILSQRLLAMSDDYFFDPDSIKIISSGLSTVDIAYKDNILKSVSDLDAIWENSTPAPLANKYRDRIITAVKKYKKEHSVQSKIRDIALALLVLLVLMAFIYAVTKLFRWIKNRFERQRGIKFKGLKFRDYELLDTNRQMKVIYSGINILQWICFLVLIYMSLLVLLGIFPWTGGLGTKLVSFFLDPTKKILISVWYYLPNLLTIIVLVIHIQVFPAPAGFF